MAKLFDLSDTESCEQYRNESFILASLSGCPGIISTQGMEVHNNCAAIFLDRMVGDVLDLIEQPCFLKAKSALDILEQACGAVALMHSRGMAHLDIKPENLLYDQCSHTPSGYRILLADFGMSEAFADQRMMKAFCGTIQYASPEACLHLSPTEGSQALPYSGKMSDVWSLGIFLHVLLTGCWPFNTFGEDEDIRQSITEGRIHLSPSIPRQFQSLIKQMLDVIPERRPSAASVLQKIRILQSHSRSPPSRSSLPPPFSRQEGDLSPASFLALWPGCPQIGVEGTRQCRHPGH